MHKKGTTLVIKIGALGDVVRTSFLAQALKNKNNNRIIWLTSDSIKGIFENNPYVDKVVGLKDKNILLDTFYDEIINLEENIDICRFASRLKHNKLRGFYYYYGKVLPTETAKEVFNMSYIGPKPMNDILKVNNKKTHRQLIGEIAEVDWKRYEPFIKLSNRQISFRNNFMRRYSLSDKDFIVGINSGSSGTWPKSLPIKKTVKLIDKLYKKYNCKIVLFGGPNEVDRNKEICSISRVPIIDTGCGNDLMDFPPLISMCDVVISTDSLGLHIALALKRKTIAMIGPTSVSEIGMYGLGKKVIAKSDQVGTYFKNKDKDIMDKIDISEVYNSVGELIDKKVSLIITSFREKTLKRAINAALKQNTKYEYNVVVVTPEDEDLDMAERLGAIPFKDPGKGKSFALNKVFNDLDSDILIFTDGDVYISDNTVEEIVNSFSDPLIGCITGRPVPVEDRKTKYGYWANVLFNAAHNIRKDAFRNKKFIECSGYLFAFRGNQIKEIPLDVAEDTYIPYIFAERGYRIGYVDKAMVYVKNVNNFKDWLLQKIRTSKAHESLDKYVDTKSNKKVKSLTGELSGLFNVLGEPNCLKEFGWTIQLILARGYMWGKVKADTKLFNKHYNDGWEASKSSK